MKKKSLAEIQKVLHGLLKNLPAVKSHCSQEVVRRHLALIAYYQRQVDLMVSAAASPAGAM